MELLDTDVLIVNGEFELWLYREKINTNVILNVFVILTLATLRGIRVTLNPKGVSEPP